MPWLILGAVLLLVIIIVGYYISTRNKFVVLEENVSNAWSQIDVSLKKRYDLIPNLVNTVKGYAKHESETFEKITSLRSRAMSASTPAETMEANSALSGAISNLLVSVENYPELKANTNFIDLQKQLSGIEGDIEMTRRFYNDSVTKFNRAIKMFPASIVAGSKFVAKDYFKVETHERENVTVSFE